MEKGRGFDFQKWVYIASFNLVSRLIGAFSRITLIFAGLLTYLLVFLTFPFAWLIWLLLPFFTYPLFQKLAQKEKTPRELFLTPETSVINVLGQFFNSRPGKFFLLRTQIPSNYFLSLPDLPLIVPDESKTDWLNLITFLGENSPDFLALLKQKGLDIKDVQRLIIWSEDNEKERLLSVRFWDPANLRRAKPLGNDLLFGYTVNLDKFTTDLTAPLPYSSHLVGRQKEAKRIEQILAKNESNNLFLLGEPGVGRTTIILNFARLVAEGRVNPALARKRVLELNLNAILARATSPAEAKNLVASILDEAIYGGNVILVIKHFDLFVSVGEGRINLTDVFLKPAASQSLQIIGVSTPSDYQKELFQNQELKKFFEVVEVAESTKEEAYQIVEKTVPVFEKNTKTLITYSAVKEAIEKAEQYITDVPFPEKSIDLLDEATVFCSQNGKNLITETEIDQLLSEKTKIPVGELGKDEKEKLLNLEEILHRRIVGQEEAVKQIAKSIKRSRTNISGKNKPIGTFLFLGPTGVGKTETAKALAFAYFGSEEKMIRLDLAEFQNPDAIDKAIGSLATKEPGLLAKNIRENPFSVLLLDEIEKANPKFLNLFLTILDEGYFSDAFGKKVNCRNLLIIGTSNAGAEFIRETLQDEITSEVDFVKQLTNYVLKHQIFSPELLNRFDGVIVFRPLTEGELAQVAKLMLEGLNKRLAPQDFSVKITPELIKKVVRLGYDPAFGARPMRRVIQDQIESQIAQRLLKGEVKKGEEIEIKI